MRKTPLAFLFLASCYYLGEDPMPIKEEVLRLGGLYTAPNEYGELPHGTMAVANNVVMRRPGVLEPIPTTSVYRTLFSGSSRMVPRMFPGESVVWAVNGATEAAMTRVSYVTASSSTFGFGPTQAYGTTTRTTQFNPGKTNMTVSRGRTIVTEASSPLVWDNPGNGSSVTPRLAGLPAPAAIACTGNTTGLGPVILANNYVKYTAVFFRDFGDGYSFRGAPSPIAIELPNAVSDSAPNLIVYWSKVNTPVVAGDFVEIYRSNQDPTEAAVPEEFSLAVRYTITSGDITNGHTATITDKTMDNARGQNLYTDQFQDGAAMANFMPPTSRDVITYKGATLYNATSSWASVQLSVPNYFGVSVETHANTANGIGARAVNVNAVASGSAVVTATAAGDVIGMVPGQQLFGTNAATYFPANTKVLTVVGTTVTFNKNAIATTGAPVSFLTADVLTVNGVDVLMTSLGAFAGNPGAIVSMATSNSGVIMVPDSAYEDNFINTGSNGLSFALINPVPDGTTFVVTGTNGANYSPPLTSAVVSNDPRTNRLYFSRVAQPESVPTINYFTVGNGTILRMETTNSALMVYCTDGIYRVTGDGVNWRVDPFDLTVFLLHPDALDSMDNTTYAWTSEGLTAITDGGVQSISGPISVDMKALWSTFKGTGLPNHWGPGVSCDSFRKEVWFNLVDLTTLGGISQYATYIYNTETKAITKYSNSTVPHSMVYAPHLLANVIATDTAVRTPTATPGNVEAAQVQPNPLWARRLGDLKQWMSIDLNWGTITAPNFTFYPYFDGVNVTNYVISGDETTVVPVPRDSALAKRLVFAFASVPSGGQTGYWQLVGVNVRYRVASQTLQQ
jgi:hypothetical protein